MIRIEKVDYDYDDSGFLSDDALDLEGYFNSRTDYSNARCRKIMKNRTRERLYELNEKKWLRRQMVDWDADIFH